MWNCTASKTIWTACMAVWEVVSNRPNEGKWRWIAQCFNKHANFPNCVGEVDGKLIRIERPGRGGSLYCNYKHYCSVAVAVAVADSNLRFVSADAGSYGKDSDASISECFSHVPAACFSLSLVSLYRRYKYVAQTHCHALIVKDTGRKLSAPLYKGLNQIVDF
jgi:hypothetical protein